MQFHHPRSLTCVIVVIAAIVLASPAAAQTVEVVDETSSDWAFVPEGGEPSYGFADGPDTPPLGTGSATFSLGDGADGVMLWTGVYAATRLADVTTLSYATYQNSDTQAAALQLNVDYDDTDSTTSWQGRLVFEPYQNGTVLADNWQSWDALAGGWWSTGTPVVGDSPVAQSCTQASRCTWATILSLYPNAAIHAGNLAGLLVKAGSGWPVGFEGAADALRVATASTDVIYDFEHVAGAPIATTRLSMNGWFSDDTRADGTAPVPEAAGTNLVSPTLTDDPEASAAGNPAHDDDITNQILFPILGPPTAPPIDSWPGAVNLRIAPGVNLGKSQISHRQDDGTGFAAGNEVLIPGFWVEYSWLGVGTTSVSASFKLGFKTSDDASTSTSPRTGENAWDKLLVYEPGNGNGNTSDGEWHTETSDYFNGTWWLVDRTTGGNSMANDMTLDEMRVSDTALSAGGRTISQVFALMAAPEAQLTTVQFGIGSYNAAGDVYVNQLQTSFYRPGQVTVFGRDPALPVVRCVPSSFDSSCELAHATIQDAIDSAADEDIVLVDSGTFSESLTIDKRLSLVGAAAGFSGCQRVASESVITASSAEDPVVTLAAGADGTSIDGFTVEGGTAGISSSGGPIDGLQIVNNRFSQATGAAISLGHDGLDVSISGNDVDGSACAASASILFDAELPGLYLNNNCVHDGLACPAVEVLGNATIGASPSRAPAISGNFIHNNLAGLRLGAGQVAAAEISSNTLTGQSDDAIAGGPVDSFIFDNLIAENGGAGLHLSSFGAADAASAARNNLVAVNCFYRNQSHALELASDQYPGTMSSNDAMYNDLRENASGASYAGSENMVAELNWWGAADGPSGDGPGSGDAVSGANLSVVPFTSFPNTWDTPCNQLADMDIDIAGPATIYPWPDDPLILSIIVSNFGPWDVADASVHVPNSAQMDYCSWTCTADGGGSCSTASDSGPLAGLLDLPAGATATITLDCSFAPEPIGAITELVTTVATPSGTTDPDPTNNSARVEIRSAIIFLDDFESSDTSAWSSTGI